MSLQDKGIPLCSCGQVPLLVSTDGLYLCRHCLQSREDATDKEWDFAFTDPGPKHVDPLEVTGVDDTAVEDVINQLLEDLNSNMDFPEESYEKLEKGIADDEDLREEIRAHIESSWVYNLGVENLDEPYESPVIIIRGTYDGEVFVAYSGMSGFYSGHSWEDWPVYLVSFIPEPPEIGWCREYLLDHDDLLTLDDLGEIAEEADDKFHELFGYHNKWSYQLTRLFGHYQDRGDQEFLLTPDYTGDNRIYVVTRKTLEEYYRLVTGEEADDGGSDG